MPDNRLNAMPPKIILWGGTGQAKVMRPIIEHYGSRVVAVFDDTPDLPSPFTDVPVYRGWAGFSDWVRDQDRKKIGFCVAIGNPHGRARLLFHERLTDEGLQAVSIAHPTAWIDPGVAIGIGAQIHAGAVVIAETRIGRQCIINTQASVDHEGWLEDGVEVAPGATLCGAVHAGVNAWICAGATVLPRIRIGSDAIVGAGAIVRRDVPDGVTVVGVPARPIVRRRERTAR